MCDTCNKDHIGYQDNYMTTPVSVRWWREAIAVWCCYLSPNYNDLELEKTIMCCFKLSISIFFSWKSTSYIKTVNSVTRAIYNAYWALVSKNIRIGTIVFFSYLNKESMVFLLFMYYIVGKFHYLILFNGNDMKGFI
jgi:hypothetical protein